METDVQIGLSINKCSKWRFNAHTFRPFTV